MGNGKNGKPPRFLASLFAVVYAIFHRHLLRIIKAHHQHLIATNNAATLCLSRERLPALKGCFNPPTTHHIYVYPISLSNPLGKMADRLKGLWQARMQTRAC